MIECKVSTQCYDLDPDRSKYIPILIYILIFILAPPTFEEKTVRLSVRKGEKASLICEASGDSPMDVFWRRNGMPISENEDAR